MEDIKQCGRCKEEKTFSCFNKQKTGRFGLHNHCKTCQKIVKKEWYWANRAKVLAKPKSEKSYQKIIEKYRSDSEYRERVKEKNRIRRRTDKARSVARIQRKKWYSLVENKIACSLRVRLRKAVKGFQNPESTIDLLSCSLEDYKKYLQSKFTEGMSFDNYGEWEIDHIIPCKFFDLTRELDRKICFHYLNTQPMWGSENKSKNAKVNLDQANNLYRTIQKLLGVK